MLSWLLSWKLHFSVQTPAPAISGSQKSPGWRASSGIAIADRLTGEREAMDRTHPSRERANRFCRRATAKTHWRYDVARILRLACQDTAPLVELFCAVGNQSVLTPVEIGVDLPCGNEIL